MDVLADLLGHARSIEELRERIRQILERTERSSRLPPILLQGETGTGKGLVAHVIHRAGPRGAGPFVDVNCAAIPEALVEAELFGFERGAFTDARQPKAGLFQSAHGGTIFLDEIALLAEPLQAKLLQVIEDRSVRRLGSTHSEPVDVSIIAATNDDLLAATQARRFREDLYHRLAVLTLRLPPLRERRDDITLLAEHFLGHACRDYGLPPKVLTSAAGAALCAYPWPGNVRELANVMERVALLVETSRIGPAMLDLPGEAVPVVLASAPAIPPGASLDARVEAWERDELCSALHESRWNVARAAVRLGISRGTIRYRIGKYSLKPPMTRVRRRGTSGLSTPESPPPLAPPPPAVTQWEHRLVALLQVTVCPRNVTEDSVTEFGRHLDVVVQKVENFAGHIEEAGPSRILAAFGLDPVEDAPRRAAFAAMAIQNALGQGRKTEAHRPAVTVAIHADDCAVGEVSGRVRVDVEAKRRMAMVLEQVGARTEPDTILVSMAARSLLGPRFEVDEGDERNDGGSSCGLRLRGYSQHRFGLGDHPAPFVGRDHELRVLQTLWQQALQQRGQAVAVVGEPGIGKSRLLFEFRRGLGDGPLTYLEGRGESYCGGIPYQPVIELLKGYFHIGEWEDPLVTGKTVKAQLLALDPSLEADVPALLALLEAPGTDPAWQALEPPQRRQRTLDALRHLVVRLSQAQPVLLAIEDLHWIDTETEAFLDRLISSMSAARLLVFVSYRPEYQHSWDSTTSYTQLHLDPLQTSSAEALVGSLLGHDIALQSVRRLLIERTEGNPFFLEETVRTLVETKALAGERGRYRLTQPVHSIRVPATVQVMLAARIDRLAPKDKRLLQVASVVGNDVPFALLQAVAELPDEALRRGLDHLRTAEFLNDTRLFPDLEYTFKHALTHEVTYGGLLQERRRELHARIVDAIETLYQDRLSEQIERLAHHAVRGELGEKAVPYLRQAGLKAAGRSALPDARLWFEQALDVLAALQESPSTLEQGFETRLELRQVLHLLGEVRLSLKRLREAEALAETLDDDRRRGRVYAVMTNVHSLLGELDEALVTGIRALEIAGRLGDLRLRLLTKSYVEQTHYFLGEYERAVELATENLAALPADWVYESFGATMPISIYTRYWLVRCLTELGRFREAAQYEAEALRLAGPEQHAYAVSMAHLTAGWLQLRRGDWARARSLLEHSLAVVRTGNVVLLIPGVLASSAWALAQLGEASKALNRLQEGEQLLVRHTAGGIVANHGWNYHALGRACLLLGRLDEARRLADRALEFSPSQPGFAAHALHLLGDIATHPDQFDTENGEAHYRRALALAEPRGMRPLVAHCHLGLGKLYRRTGRRQQAHDHLTTAMTMFREMDMRFSLEQTEAEMSGLA